MVLLAVVATLGLVARNSGASDEFLPPAVASKVTFPVFMPDGEATATYDQTTVSYQADADVLSYTAKLAGGEELYINQQPTPESFIDIPQAYDKLIASLQPYSTFDTANGRVSLTKPKELNGKQSAVMNAKGTLMFIRSETDLSDSQWRQVFNNLKII